MKYFYKFIYIKNGLEIANALFSASIFDSHIKIEDKEKLLLKFKEDAIDKINKITINDLNYSTADTIFNEIV